MNAMQAQYDMDEWAFIEVAQDIRDIKNQLKNKIGEVMTSSFSQSAAQTL